MSEFRFLVARGGFVLLFLGLTLLQLLSFPGQFQHMRRVEGISLILEISLTVLVGLWLFCGQFAIVSLWKIVGEIKVGQFFGTQSLKWIDRLIYAQKTACVIPVLLFALLAPQADDPGFFVLLAVVTLFLVVLATVSTLLREQINSKI